MTTTPLPPTQHDHPDDDWTWTPSELVWIAARDAQWKTYAAAARADLEAENKRLREALNGANEIVKQTLAARKALKETP